MENLKIRNNLKVNVGGETIDQWGTFKRNKRDIKREFLDNEGQQYILTNNLEGFYNKALIYQNYYDSTNYILVSYNTIVAEILGDKFVVYGYWSETTKRHINAFLNYFNINQFSKKEILQIESEWLNRKDYKKEF